MSAVVLGLLPMGIGGAMWIVDPEYISVLFHDPLGQAMLLGAAGLAVAGFFWMKKTVDVEV